MENEQSNGQLAGMVCGGCLFIGMGIGWAMGSLKVGLYWFGCWSGGHGDHAHEHAEQTVNDKQATPPGMARSWLSRTSA